MQSMDYTRDYSRRWYDARPEYAACIRLIEAFPADIQSIIATSMIELAEEEFRVQELLTSLRSLGPERILGIHKSKNKKRYFDQNPLIHKAMNYFFILSEPHRIFLARHVHDLVRIFYEYLGNCRNRSRSPWMEDMQQLAAAHRRQGVKDAQRMLAALQSNQTTSSSGTLPQMDDQSIREHSEGMKIRKKP